jgi:hypothetical protein
LLIFRLIILENWKDEILYWVRFRPRAFLVLLLKSDLKTIWLENSELFLFEPTDPIYENCDLVFRIVACCLLLVACYLLLAACYLLLVACYLLLVACYLLLVACFMLLVHWRLRCTQWEGGMGGGHLTHPSKIFNAIIH